VRSACGAALAGTSSRSAKPMATVMRMVDLPGSCTPWSKLSFWNSKDEDRGDAWLF
jgi:hypothetical protein